MRHGFAARRLNTYAMVKYSIIIPVYNRPDEVDELLASLTRQTLTDFEVIVVEDGSTLACRDVCSRYEGRLDLHYYRKPNSGPGQSRNYGESMSSYSTATWWYARSTCSRWTTSCGVSRPMPSAAPTAHMSRSRRCSVPYHTA